MIKIPECLDRRYKALDDIIQELSSSISSQRSLCRERSSTSNVGIKLMCDFWKILKEDPDCNLTEEVQERMGMEPVSDKTHNMYGKQEYMAYMAGKICCKDKKASLGADKGKCCKTASGSKVQTDDDKKLASLCCGGSGAMKTTSSTDTSIALTKVLCNLQEAASFDKKCEDRVKDLMDAQKLLKDQVQALEAKEKNGIQLLKQADCMWLCMEDAYKNKIKESQERQDILIKELKEIEASVSKWRKNKKDLEYQINNITKARMEIAEKMHQKKNDIKVMTSENHNLTKRLESAKKDLENSKNSISSTKQASDARIETLSADMKNIQKRTTEEKSHMKKKEEEGTQYVKEARADLQSICKVLLQKKLENEDLRAEKTAVLEEMDLLLTTLGTCQVRCKNKEESLIEELKAITKELATFEAKCKKCHICVDTNDVRKLCTDCPKCSEERKCNVDGEHCQSDPTMDCVCMAVKHKFLDNVFDNMYTVLERQSRTPGGKAVADAVLRALRRSTNGKLTADVRHILQEFVLSTVKKNLNLTIVGGAVKTRCELDAETYKQLMNCLKSVKAVKPKQEDKGTLSKKDPCKRWGASSECHCPKGPKDCICTRKAPPRPNDPTPIKQDKEDMPPPKVCPYRDPKICGPDCAMQGRSAGSTRDMGNEISTWRPDPCSGRDCPYNKDTRAAMAQCVLGFESMDQSMSRKNACTCNTTRLKSCHCHRDRRSRPREKIIGEVMGRYCVAPAIAKVTCTGERYFDELNASRKDTACDCSSLSVKYVLAMNESDISIAIASACSSVYKALHDPVSYANIFNLNKNIHLVTDSNSSCASNYNKSQHKTVRTLFKCKNIAQFDDDNVQVIFHPKHENDKKNVNLDTSDIVAHHKGIVRSKVDSSKIISRIKLTVCDTLYKLIKDFNGTSDKRFRSNQFSRSVEWVNVKELFQQINKLTESEHQNKTTTEVELKYNTFEELKKN